MKKTELIIKITRIKYIAPEKGIIGKTRTAIMNKLQKEVFISTCLTFGKIFKHHKSVIYKELDKDDTLFILVDESDKEEHDRIIKTIKKEAWDNLGLTQIADIKRKLSTVFKRKNINKEHQEKTAVILDENPNWVKLNDFLANSLFIYIDIDLKVRK